MIKNSSNSLLLLSKEQLIEQVKCLKAEISSLQKIRKRQQNPSNKKARTGRPLDFSKFAVRPIAIKFAYFGWNYHGLEAREMDDVETVEQHIFDALIKSKLIPDRKSCRFSRCGRTDKGVSSFGQVASFLIRSNFPKGALGDFDWAGDQENPTVYEKVMEGGSVEYGTLPPTWTDPETGEVLMELPYISILNRQLPHDIRILGWSDVDLNVFDARFSCTSRKYKYYFPKGNLNVETMDQASKLLLGLHDFRNFCKIDTSKSTTVFDRRIHESSIRPHGFEDLSDQEFNSLNFSHKSTNEYSPDMYVFSIKGSSFLWHQVRCMMSVLMLVGAELEAPSVISDLLDISTHPLDKGRPMYDMACELPLVLVECGYDGVALKWVEQDDDVKLGEPIKRLNPQKPAQILTTSTSPQKIPPNELKREGDFLQFKLISRVMEMWRTHNTKTTLLNSFLMQIAKGNDDYLLAVTKNNSMRGNVNKFGNYEKMVNRARCDGVEDRRLKGEKEKNRFRLNDEEKELLKKSEE